MAITDNALNGRIVKEAYGKGKVTLTAACEMGDLLTKAGALAIATATTTLADWVALEKAASGVEIEVARIATISGLTGGTLGDLAYLSDTAGGYGSAAGTVEQVVGLALSATDIVVAPSSTFLSGGNVTVPDNILLALGTGNTARLSWSTADANANKLLLQLPAGGSVDVPVLAIGQSIEGVDQALYNGTVNPLIAIFGVGAVTTAPIVEFRKARGTITAPTAVTTGDDLGTIAGYACVAAGEWVQAAKIEFDSTGTIATTRGAGIIRFSTATDAAPSVMTTALTISAAQLVTAASLTSTGAFTASSTSALNGDVTVADDILLGLGTGNTARLSYDTTDTNANALLLQLPAGGAVDVPVLAIGQSIESVDLGLFNGVVDPTIAVFGVGAVATSPRLRVYKARGTITAPTAITTGDDLFGISAYAAVAAGEYVESVRVTFDSTGTIATTRGAGIFKVAVATDAAPSVMTDRLAITGSLQITITPETDTVFANGTGVIIGHTAQVVAGGVTSELQVHGTAPADSTMLLAAWSADAVAPRIYLAKSRSATIGTFGIITTADVLGQILAYGDDGVDFNSNSNASAEIRFSSTGTIAADRIPGTITFLTATDAAPSVLTQAMLISAAQLVTCATLTSTGAFTASSTSALNGNVTVADDVLLGVGTGNTARLSYDTTDADANALFLQLPAGGATDVPLLAIGQSIESIDLGLYNGLVDPRIVMFGVGAVTTATGIDFRKARGTIAAPTVVTSGDDLGTIRAYGAVANAEYVQAAEIRFDMAGTIATTRGPGTITFLTATDAAPSVLTQAMIISAAQLVTVAAGLTLTTGNLTFGAATDVVVPAATAAALEVSDGVTKFLALDTRVTTVAVTTLALDISDYTLASAAGAVATALSLLAHNLNYTGNTQVTTQVDTVVIGARSLIGAVAITVDEANSLLLVAPAEGANVTLTAASALRVVDATGSPVTQYGIYIEDLTAGATSDYGIYIAGADTAAICVASADPIQLGTAGTATGKMQISGATSGTVTLTVGAAAGTWTMTLPAAVGGAGEQLTDAAGNGITSWAAAASLRDYKDVIGLASKEEALACLLAAPVHRFHYKPGKGTQDIETEYVGVMADEAPWAMHYQGSIVNPVNTLGYTVLGFQAMAERIRGLEKRLEALTA